METTPLDGLRINIRGIVQGVGFRPFVYSLAREHHLNGWVLNSSSGVQIEVDGTPAQLAAFSADLRAKMPPLAKIDEIQQESIPPQSFTGFEIRHSLPQAGEFIPVSPDTSICEDCRRELFDPADRRYRYPFINCTNCGPRFTIIRDIPYDRPYTAMADFPLCADCRMEYENPLDRRFHAQPVACDVCGPQVWYQEDGAVFARKDDAIQNARKALQNGKILAVKGLGGYHLACDAANPFAVAELRRRKRRSDKPFALMAFDLETVETHCCVPPQEAEILISRQKPIVLLQRKPGCSLPAELAPGQLTLGFMLPYTPLHLLLMEPATGFPPVLVMTSGNLSEEPIAYEDDDAIQRLSPLADGFLLHDRPIHISTDDSVVQVLRNDLYPIRRSRGYAPDPLVFNREFPQILAAGAELKNTFCLSRERYAFLSHHIGDLENYETERSFTEGIRHFEKLFRIQPQAIACDLHPAYLASAYAHRRAEQESLPLVEIHHHHAHLAACLAEHERWDTRQEVIGCIFDGTGYGTDGAVWGGEFLVGNIHHYERASHLPYVPQPGGDRATRKPAVMALAHLWQAQMAWNKSLPSCIALTEQEKSVLDNQLTRQVNTPLTSSMGRLFDAVSSLIGIRHVVNYEGQAAIEMEAVASRTERGWYPIHVDPTSHQIDLDPFWTSFLDEILQGIPQAVLAARFHNSIVQLTQTICCQLRQERQLNTVVLSGGVWQNRYLFNRTVSALETHGFEVLTHRQVPTNDGGIALGQLAGAASVLELKPTRS
ncbi:MAG: carbamoyltransferase HypF [Anaerolineae bacterium]|nr:carbamoyltransferase HypF [Anaerolineae bacterium]